MHRAHRQSVSGRRARRRLPGRREPRAPRRRGRTAPATAFFNDPDSLVNKWVAANPNDSRRARIASRIAAQPQAVWFSRYYPRHRHRGRPQGHLRRRRQGPGARARRVPDPQPRLRRGLRGRRARSRRATTPGSRGFAAGLGSGPVDRHPRTGLDRAHQLPVPRRAERPLRLARPRRRAIHGRRTPRPGSTSTPVTPRWNSPAVQASRLRSAGVARPARRHLQQRLQLPPHRRRGRLRQAVLAPARRPPGLAAVIDTSRNGNGPAPDGDLVRPARPQSRREPDREHRRGRASTPTCGSSCPGELDGCKGAPGTFSPDYAYELARLTVTWVIRGVRKPSAPPGAVLSPRHPVQAVRGPVGPHLRRERLGGGRRLRPELGDGERPQAPARRVAGSVRPPSASPRARRRGRRSGRGIRCTPRDHAIGRPGVTALRCRDPPGFSARRREPLGAREREEPEVLAEHRDRHVVDGHAADLALEGARVGVAVEHEVGRVLDDRRGEAVGPQERPDVAPLPSSVSVVGA